MTARKPKPDPDFIVLDVNYDEVEEVRGGLSDLSDQLASMSSEHEYTVDDASSAFIVYSVERVVRFEPEAAGLSFYFPTPVV